MKKTKQGVGLNPVSAVSVLFRYGILSGQAGLATGSATLLATCARGCAGYGEAIWAYGAGLLAAIILFIALLIRHSIISTSRERLRREATWQWAWICLSTFIAMVIMA